MTNITVKPIAALGLALLIWTTGPAVAQEDPGLTPDEQIAVGAAWLDRLNRYYASGDPVDLPSTTPQGLESLRSYDWRFRAVEAEDGSVRFSEAWDLFESTPYDELVVGDEHAMFELRLGYDVARLAEALDAASGQILEMTDGVQRRVFNAAFVPGAAAGEWALDQIRVPQAMGSFDFFSERAPVVPCPRMGNPARAGNPFRMRPWCTANGDGRRLTVGGYRGGQERPYPDLAFTGRNNCWSNAVTIVVTGWPPGSQIEPNTDFRYIRDPRGEVSAAGAYRRNVRPPRDAVSTGVTNGYATIWTSEALGSDAILMQVGNRFERWPSTDAGCTGN